MGRGGRERERIGKGRLTKSEGEKGKEGYGGDDFPQEIDCAYTERLLNL
jgi:hypothetical protein